MFFAEYIKLAQEEMRLRNYSPRTIQTYTHCLIGYFKFLAQLRKQPDELPSRDVIKQFLLQKHELGNASQTINLFLNAIKFFYREVQKSTADINITYAKRTKKIPVVLSRSEISSIIHALKNRKHKLLLSLAYGSGLRVSESVALKVEDIDIEGSILWIRKAKGDRDRMSMFPEKLKMDFSKWLYGRPKGEYVFESERGGKLTTRSAQKIFTKALQMANIQKEATFHSLRHSFATHLLENGVDIRFVQELLGHKNIKTTLIYTRIANHMIRNIKSPL